MVSLSSGSLDKDDLMFVAQNQQTGKLYSADVDADGKVTVNVEVVEGSTEDTF